SDAAGAAAWCAAGECDLCLRDVCLEGILAGGYGALLSASGQQLEMVADLLCSVIHGSGYSAGSHTAPEAAVAAAGMAVVPGHIGAGDWNGAGGRASNGGPLCLSAANWNIPDGRLGGRRSRRPHADKYSLAGDGHYRCRTCVG